MTALIKTLLLLAVLAVAVLTAQIQQADQVKNAGEAVQAVEENNNQEKGCPHNQCQSRASRHNSNKPSHHRSSEHRQGSNNEHDDKSDSHCEDHCHEFRFEQERIFPSSQLHPFSFGEAGTYARQSFYFFGQTSTVLDVFDCFCGGDMFRVYDNGVWLADATYNCEYAFGTCNYFGGSAEECQEANEGFCRFFEPQLLLPGFHNITIYVLANYYKDGVAFLSLDNAQP